MVHQVSRPYAQRLTPGTRRLARHFEIFAAAAGSPITVSTGTYHTVTTRAADSAILQLQTLYVLQICRVC